VSPARCTTDVVHVGPRRCYNAVQTCHDLNRSDQTRMHYDAHQPVIDELEARILTIRDSL